VRAYAHLTVVRDTAKIEVFHASSFEGTRADDVGSFAGHAFDVFVGSIL